MFNITSLVYAQNGIIDADLGSQPQAGGVYYTNPNNSINQIGQQSTNLNSGSNQQSQNGNSSLGTNIYQKQSSTYNQNPQYNNNPNGNPNSNMIPNYQQPNQPLPGGTYNQTGSLELQDYGVQPINQLFTGNFHSPTPNSIPGGRVITTQQFKSMIMQGSPVLILDVLGEYEHIPGAVDATLAANSGSFSDNIQQMFRQYLMQATNNNKQAAIVLYCQSSHCWMSYNAALRAIHLGYSNVFWYRGGIEAWKRNGLTVQTNYPQNPQYGNLQYGNSQYQNPQNTYDNYNYYQMPNQQYNY